MSDELAQAPSDDVHAVADEVFAKLTAEKPAPSEDEADATPEAPEAEQAPDTAEGEVDPSEEEAHSEEAEQPEKPEKPAKIDDDTSVEVQGEKVTLKELKRGFLRERDYTKKTQALAGRERELTQGIEAERKQFRDYMAEVQSFVEMVNPLSAYEKLDWMQLARDDQANGTNNYSLLKAQFDQLKEGQVKVSTATRAAQEKELKDRHAKMGAWAQDQVQQIGDRYPEVKDPAKAKAITKEMDAYASDVGFTEQELTSQWLFRDARMWTIIREAALYRKAEAAKKAVVTKRVDQPAKVIAPKGGREAVPVNVREKQALKRKATAAMSDRERAEHIFRLSQMR